MRRKVNVEGSDLQKPHDLPGSATRTSSLRNGNGSHKLSQSIPELSHKKMRMNAACWHLSVNVHKNSQKRMSTLEIFTSKTWFVCLNMFECLKNVGTFQTPTFSSKNVLPSDSQKNSANVKFSFMMSPSDLLATQVLNAFRTLHNSFIIERHTKLLHVQTELSAYGEKPSRSNLPDEFTVAKTQAEGDGKYIDFPFHYTHSKLHRIVQRKVMLAITIYQWKFWHPLLRWTPLQLSIAICAVLNCSWTGWATC